MMSYQPFQNLELNKSIRTLGASLDKEHTKSFHSGYHLSTLNHYTKTFCSANTYRLKKVSFDFLKRLSYFTLCNTASSLYQVILQWV